MQLQHEQPLQLPSELVGALWDLLIVEVYSQTRIATLQICYHTGNDAGGGALQAPPRRPKSLQGRFARHVERLYPRVCQDLL